MDTIWFSQKFHQWTTLYSSVFNFLYKSKIACKIVGTYLVIKQDFVLYSGSSMYRKVEKWNWQSLLCCIETSTKYSDIWKKVQFRGVSLFASKHCSKPEINVFKKFLTKRTMYIFHDSTNTLYYSQHFCNFVPKRHLELALKTDILVPKVAYDLPEFKIRP